MTNFTMTQPVLFDDYAIRRVMHDGEWHLFLY